MINSTSIGTRIDHTAQTPGSWAGGTTNAIYAYPPDSIGTPANAQLWVGTAVIDRASAYSFFPQRRRVHVPIHGNGLRLHFQNPAEVIALGTFAQYRFDGARPVRVELLDGAVVAFNLIIQTNVAAEVQVLDIGSQELALELDRAPAALALTSDAARVVHVVYAANGEVAIEIAGQPAITLHAADAFVFHARALGQPPGVKIGLRGLEAHADVIVATLVFGSADTELESGYRAMAADEEREAEASQSAEATTRNSDPRLAERADFDPATLHDWPEHLNELRRLADWVGQNYKPLFRSLADLG
jgi:environmental stress-induced protein Ves